MPNFIRTLAVFTRDTGLPEDNTVMTFHHVGDGTNTFAVDLALAAAGVSDFVLAIDEEMPSSLVGPTCSLKCYDLEDPEPRVPVLETSFSITTNASTAAPPEVAIGLSYQGDRVAGEPQARRRGRLFIGPVSSNVYTVTGGRCSITSGDRTLVANAAAILANNPAGDAQWAVFSPTTYAETAGTVEARLSAAMTVVTNGWVDDELDIQRRRGTRASTRTLWTA